MIKIRYAQIENSDIFGTDYEPYATELRRRFGGEELELTEAVAQFCVEQDYCVYGGACCLLGILDGGDWRIVIPQWESEAENSDDLVRGRFESSNDWYRARWKHLFDWASRHEEAKRARAEAIAAQAAMAAEAKGPQIAAAPQVRVITAVELERLGACQSQVQKFRATFEESTPINQETLQRALDAGLEIGFLSDFCNRLLAPEHLDAFREERDRLRRECLGNTGGTCICGGINRALVFAKYFNLDVAREATDVAQDAPAQDVQDEAPAA